MFQNNNRNFQPSHLILGSSPSVTPRIECETLGERNDIDIRLFTLHVLVAAVVQPVHVVCLISP